jgi:hypothetical protein
MRHIGTYESREARLDREAAARVNSNVPEIVAFIASAIFCVGVIAMAYGIAGGF